VPVPSVQSSDGDDRKLDLQIVVGLDVLHLGFFERFQPVVAKLEGL
jgi:hypothetical protein